MLNFSEKAQGESAIWAVFDKNEIIIDVSKGFGFWSQIKAAVGQKLDSVLSFGDIYSVLAPQIRRAKKGTPVKLNISPDFPDRSHCTVSVSPIVKDGVGHFLMYITPDAVTESNHLCVDKAHQYLNTAIDMIDQAMAVFDSDLKLVVWNSLYEESNVFPKDFIREGVELEEIYYTMAKREMFGKCNKPDLLAKAMISTLKNKPENMTSILQPPGSNRTFKIGRYILPDGGVCAVFSDISEQQNYQQELIKQAHTDSLTGIYNRHGIMTQLSASIESKKHLKKIKTPAELQVLFIDLDLFKQANETYGHKFGDEVLRETAQRLTSLINVEKGDFLGRLGGDEFIIVLDSMESKVEVDKKCAEIIASISNPFVINNRSIFISCSIGISYFPEHGDDAEDLLTRADTAMYHAKTQGRKSTWFYTNTLSENITKSTLVVAELKKQLLQNNEQFSLKYQPIVDLKNLTVVGSEALLRWKLANDFDINTEEFVKILEEKGMIIDVGNIILCQALSAYKVQLHKLPDDFHLALNISAMQINQHDFVDTFTKIQDQFQVPSSKLLLEITETALLSNSLVVKSNMLKLRERGINIAIDDFGTGFSSLSNLKEYPFTHLKIDRSFIGDVSLNSEHKYMLKAILDLSRAFNLQIVAEGIESKEQLIFLREHGCQFGQGYLFDKPLEFDEMLAVKNYSHLCPRQCCKGLSGLSKARDASNLFISPKFTQAQCCPDKCEISICS